MQFATRCVRGRARARTRCGTPGRVYARGGIPRYWVVNLAARSVEVFEQPGEGGYGLVTTLTEQDELSFVLDGRVVGTLRVAEVMPPAS